MTLSCMRSGRSVVADWRFLARMLSGVARLRTWLPGTTIGRVPGSFRWSWLVRVLSSSAMGTSRWISLGCWSAILMRLSSLDLPAAVRDALSASGITEVVVLGRRGPEAAAYSASALRDLLTLDGVEVVVAQSPREQETPDAHHSPTLLNRLSVGSAEPAAGMPSEVSEWWASGLLSRRLDLSGPPRAGRRIVLRFDTTPIEWDAAVGLKTTAGVIAAGNLFGAIGFSGRPVPGLPFDAERGIVPNDRGAVDGRPGHYVTGWIKRGARGGIGANKACAEETVRTLLVTRH